MSSIDKCYNGFTAEIQKMHRNFLKQHNFKLKLRGQPHYLRLAKVATDYRR